MLTTLTVSNHLIHTPNHLNPTPAKSNDSYQISHPFPAFSPPAFAETHPGNLLQAPGEEMKEAVPFTTGREKQGSLPGELD